MFVSGKPFFYYDATWTLICAFNTLKLMTLLIYGLSFMPASITNRHFFFLKLNLIGSTSVF
jgi:uncharacterized membrane protein